MTWRELCSNRSAHHCNWWLLKSLFIYFFSYTLLQLTKQNHFFSTGLLLQVFGLETMDKTLSCHHISLVLVQEIFQDEALCNVWQRPILPLCIHKVCITLQRFCLKVTYKFLCVCMDVQSVRTFLQIIQKGISMMSQCVCTEVRSIRIILQINLALTAF